jgi:hypothetical protein
MLTRDMRLIVASLEWPHECSAPVLRTRGHAAVGGAEIEKALARLTGARVPVSGERRWNGTDGLPLPVFA